MRRSDSSVYRACLDESLDVLRTIEFIKVATAYKQANQGVDPNYNAYKDIHNLPGIIRSLRYTSTAGSAPGAPTENGVFKTSYSYAAPHDGHANYRTLELQVTPNFQFDLNNFKISNGQITFGDDTFTVHDISGYYTVTGYKKMKDGWEQEPVLELMEDSVYQVVKPYTETQTLTFPGLFRGFRVRLVDKPNEAYYYSIGCSIQSITIPKYMTTLGEYCFYNASNLQSITIQADIVELPAYCFAYTSSLTNFTLPKSVKIIKHDCFSHSHIAYNTVLDLSSKALTTIEDRAFEYCQMGGVTIGSTVTSIGESAFAMCERLSVITFECVHPPVLDTDVTGNATSFYKVAPGGHINIPSNASVDEWVAWMSSEAGAYSHLSDYNWTIYQNGEQVWPE